MTRHGPDCFACTDPAAAAAQITADRAALDTEAVRAREHRSAGEVLDLRARQYLTAGRRAAAQVLDGRARLHLQAANAIATGVRFSRSQLERVIAAHPAVAKHLEPHS